MLQIIGLLRKLPYVSELNLSLKQSVHFKERLVTDLLAKSLKKRNPIRVHKNVTLEVENGVTSEYAAAGTA
jgi:hypothetical protein